MIFGFWLSCATLALGDDDHERGEHERGEHEEEEEGLPSSSGPSGVAPVTDPTWKSECGSCHMAYPPGLLPARSWTLILSDLGNHFGDDASVDPKTLSALQSYAQQGAADRSPYRLSAAIARASAGLTPSRILETGWLREEHNEMSPSRWRDNPAVRSLSSCPACHTRAAEGRFFEGEIQIPRSQAPSSGGARP